MKKESTRTIEDALEIYAEDESLWNEEARLMARDKEEISGLLNSLRTDTGHLRYIAAQYLTRIPDDSPKYRVIWRELAAALRTGGDPKVTYTIAYCLGQGKIATVERCVIEATLSATGSGMDMATRRWSIYALGQASLAYYPQISARLESLRQDPNESIANEAQEAQERLHMRMRLQQPEVRQALRTLSKSAPPIFRTDVKEVLLDMQPLEKKVADTLNKPVTSVANWLRSNQMPPFLQAPRFPAVRAEIIGFEPPEEEEVYETTGKGEFNGIRYQLRQAQQNPHCELVVETRLFDEDKPDLVVLITLRDLELENLTASNSETIQYVPVYLMLSKQGNWATGSIKLIPGVEAPVSIVKVEPGEIVLEHTLNLKRSCLAQIQDNPQTATPWRAWIQQLPVPVRETIEKELPNEHNSTD